MEDLARYLPQYSSAEELESHLGDPWDPANRFSLKRAVELDEREEYPEEACRLLERWGMHQYYVPAEFGGRLQSYEEVLALLRVIARRDLTVGIAHGKTYLGAAAVWVGGTDIQKQKLAEIIGNTGQVALGLTEQAHGSDILASEVQAVVSGQGYLLSGEKWLINNATRSKAIVVFARSDVKGGPRGFSLFLVEKDNAGKASYRHLPKVKTHGIRGADISGIRFDRCPVPAEGLIGGLGSGLEIALKKLQISRTIVPALSLGAGDTALRTTLGFALSRKLYGGTVFDISQAQDTLVGAFLDLLTCDCVAVTAARALHLVPEQMSVLSAVVKYFVPTTIENMVRNLSVVLGARHYLREGHDWGVFQKILRDSAIVSLFDGSTSVNLNVIGLQLRQLADWRGKGDRRNAGGLRSRLESLYDLTRPLPPFNPAGLQLTGRGRDDLLQGIEAALSDLRGSQTAVDPGVLEDVTALTGLIIEELNALEKTLSGLTKNLAADKSPELFALSQRYCALHAAAACLQVWRHNRGIAGDFFVRGEWLVLCLERLMIAGRSARTPSRQPYVANVSRELVRLYRENRLFSIVPFQLALTRAQIQEDVIA